MIAWIPIIPWRQRKRIEKTKEKTRDKEKERREREREIGRGRHSIGGGDTLRALCRKKEKHTQRACAEQKREERVDGTVAHLARVRAHLR